MVVRAHSWAHPSDREKGEVPKRPSPGYEKERKGRRKVVRTNVDGCAKSMLVEPWQRA
jgi:hypothetical protein